jgi:hypothetical protein
MLTKLTKWHTHFCSILNLLNTESTLIFVLDEYDVTMVCNVHVYNHHGTLRTPVIIKRQMEAKKSCLKMKITVSNEF